MKCAKSTFLNPRFKKSGFEITSNSENVKKTKKKYVQKCSANEDNENNKKMNDLVLIVTHF